MAWESKQTPFFKMEKGSFHLGFKMVGERADEGFFPA